MHSANWLADDGAEGLISMVRQPADSTMMTVVAVATPMLDKR